jgi:hypothetical protein
MSTLHLPLEQLNDILPGPAPATPLWHILLPVTVLLILGLVWYGYRRYQTKWRFYFALRKQLATLSRQPEDELIPAINVFLKQVLILFVHDREFAHLHTREWLIYLDAYALTTHFSQFQDQWERWNYGSDTLTAAEKKQVLRECRHFLRAIRFRRPL